jgi:hypothetical protein
VAIGDPTLRQAAIALLLAALLVTGSARAQPVDTVLIDRSVPLTSGQVWQDCPYVDDGILTIDARADAGRSGETANFLFAPNRQTVRPDAYLAVPLGADPVVASFRVGAGSFCFYVMMTNRYPVPAGTSAYDTPVKISTIKVTYQVP